MKSKKGLVFILLILLFTLLFATSVSARQIILFNDTFEDGDCSNWGNCIINSTTVYNGTYSGTTGVAEQITSPTFNTTKENFNVTYWLYPIAPTTAIFLGVDDGVDKLRGASIVYQPTGGGTCPSDNQYCFYNGSSYLDSNQAVTYSTWVKVTIEFNNTLGNNYYNFYLDGVLVNHTVPFSSTASLQKANLTTIRFSKSAAANKPATFDDILVHEGESNVPTLLTNFTNGTIVSAFNLSAFFNVSDDVFLWNFNLTLDDDTTSLYNKTGLNVTDYWYNLSYNTSHLSLGNHTLILKFSDGHTAQELGGEYDFRNGLFDDYSRYDFYDEGYIKTSLKESSIFDRWTSTELSDRYTQTLEPANPSSTITLVEESDLPINIINKPGHYNNQWLIIGNHWKDYVIKNEDVGVSIRRINAYKVEVTISGIKNTEQIEFESVGDLNIVERHFFFVHANVTSTVAGFATEYEEQTAVFEVNFTGALADANATFVYDGIAREVTKTHRNISVRFESTFITPLITGSSPQTNNYYWDYILNYTGGVNESAGVNGSQSVYSIGIDNCTNPYDIRALNFSVRSENNNSILPDVTVDGYFEVWIDAIGNFTKFNLTWGNGSVPWDDIERPFGICITPNTSIYYTFAQFEYTNPNHDTKLYYFDNITLDNTTKIFDFYLTNGTTQVKFVVQDTNDEPISDAVIKILSYDPGTDSTKTTEVIKTNIDGEAWGQIKLNTQYYKFIIEKDGEVLDTIDRTIISTTTVTFRINIFSDYFQTFDDVGDIEYVLSYTNSTKFFDLTYIDHSITVDQVCLEIRKEGNYARTILNTSCLTSSDGSIRISIVEDVDTNTYTAIAYAIENTKEYFIDSLTVGFDYEYDQYGVTGIFIAFLLILALVLIGIWSPQASLVMMLIGFVMVQILGLYHFSWPILTAFILLIVFTLYRGSR